MKSNTRSGAEIVLIDNFDSFTYNLVEQCRLLGHDVIVFRNTVPFSQIQKTINSLTRPLIMLSPGPGMPKQAGCMPILLAKLKGKLPIIGICLGHQAIVEAYGGKVAGCGEIVHGKAALLETSPHPVFDQLPTPFSVARYHSLVATKVPDTLSVIAAVNQVVMAVVSEKDKVIGYQFHPESILTTYGADLLENTINWALDNKQKES